jgi:activator of 2-hydroxyglutaryl-CoA dehydratase
LFRFTHLRGGGVAKKMGVVKALEKKLGMAIRVLEYAQLKGAIGAAVLAAAMKQVIQKNRLGKGRIS